MPIAYSVVIILIAINAIVFYASLSLGDLMYDHFALFYPMNDKFEVWQFVTHIFMHGGFAHLLLNMFGLLIFGSLLEKVWGKRRFLVFYLLSGIGAAAIYLTINYFQFNDILAILQNAGLSQSEIKGMLEEAKYPPSLLSEEQAGDLLSIYHSPMVGASGALYGLLVAFALLFPNHKMFLIFLPIPIAAKYFIPALVALDLGLGFYGSSLFGSVAHFAHVGGAIMGLILMLPVFGYSRFRGYTPR